MLTFATPQQALDALYTDPQLTVYIDGVMTDVISFNAQHNVKQPVATARLTLPLPRPAHVKANATVEVQGGHNSLVGTLFSGRIPSWQNALSDNGDLLTINAAGWMSLLAYRERFDLTYDGPILIADLFDSLCARRGLPAWRADRVTDPTGTIDIALGGNQYADDGIVTVPASGGLIQFLTNIVEPFGYRVYDSPGGTVGLSRISGSPTAPPAVTFLEGKNIGEGTRAYSVADIVNYHDVYGVTYENEIGASIPIRSIPAQLNPHPDIPVNDGINYEPYRNSLLVTQQLAEIVRNVREIDMGAPTETVRWRSVAVPNVSPGDVAMVQSPTLETSQAYWIMSTDVTYDDSGFTASWEGWSGGGQALPAGVDRIEIPLQSAPVHLGDEFLSWYAHPAPQGTSWEWTFSVPERATAVNVIGLAHGVNSQVLGGVQTDLEVSKFELWRQGNDDRAESSGNLPVMNEDLNRRLDYTNIANWSPFAVNLRRTDAGSVTLKLIAGVKGGVDDFEVRDVYVEIFGATEPPIIPGEVW